MTKSINAARARLVLILFVLAVVLLVPAAAFADSGSDTESDSSTSSEPADYGDSGTTDTGEKADVTKEASADHAPVSEPAPAGDSATDSPLHDPSSDLNDDPATDTPSETPTPETETAVEEAAEEESDGSEESASGGNSYTATITPDGVVIDDDTNFNSIPGGYDGPIAGESCEFTITFTEVGDKELAAAMVQINDNFTYDNAVEATVEASNYKNWYVVAEEDTSYGWVLKLYAHSSDDYLIKGEEVSVTFSATTPTMWGIYPFTTWAWIEVPGGFLDVSFSPYAPAHNDIVNSMAAGYSNPVVIVGESISSADELAAISLEGYYVQTADINLGVAPYNEGTGWIPIGDMDDKFTGAYSGNGFTISNLTIKEPDRDYIGLFGATDDLAYISNVSLVDVTVEGINYVGSLVGYNKGTIINCSATGNVFGSAIDHVLSVGGLVGENDSGTITDCYSQVGVTVSAGGDVWYVGGLVGDNDSGTITNCYAAGAVNVDASDHVWYVGGLVGENTGTITSCRAAGAVNATSLAGDVNDVGGLAGYNNDGTITDCYATGNVNVTTSVGDVSYVGGLAGDNSGHITDSYAVGHVGVDSSGNVYHVGGLVGYNNFEGAITDSYAVGAVTVSAGGDVWYIGGLVGENFEGAITDSYAMGAVTVSAGGDVWYIGGLVGENTGTITDSYATGAVNVKTTGTSIDYIGGLVGRNGGSITRSYATGYVDVDSGDSVYYIGGLVGENFEGAITDSAAMGAVTVEADGYVSDVGGLVGYNNGDINNSYAVGAVNVTVTSTNGTVNNVGGLVGNNYGTITNCYAASAVKVAVTSTDSNVDFVGGLVGYNESTISGCGAVPYSGLLIGNQPAPDDDDVRAITAADMMKIATFVDWDIIGIEEFNPDAVPNDDDFHVWYIDEGNDYPRLWWQYEAGGDDPIDDPVDPGEPDDDNDPVFNDGSQTMGSSNFPLLGSLVLANGGQPFVTADFIKTGTATDLARAFSLYYGLLRAFEENRETMTPGEYARAMVELTTAWAAIMALEARLLYEAGLKYDPAPLVSAYQAALANFNTYRVYLSEAEVGAVQAILNAVAEIIGVLGLTV